MPIKLIKRIPSLGLLGLPLMKGGAPLNVERSHRRHLLCTECSAPNRNPPAPCAWVVDRCPPARQRWAMGCPRSLDRSWGRSCLRPSAKHYIQQLEGTDSANERLQGPGWVLRWYPTKNAHTCSVYTYYVLLLITPYSGVSNETTCALANLP